MTPFDGILFDFDGVLIDSEPLHFACWAEVLRPVGVDLEWDFYSNYCIGIDDREMLRMMATRSNPPREWSELWSLYPAKRDLFRERTLKLPPFHPALSELLEELRGFYKMAVVTSSGRTEIEPLLQAASLRDFFGVMVCGREAGGLKPLPDPYLKAARDLGVKQPLVVEDSAAGIAAGRAAGFEVLAINSPSDVPRAVRERLRVGEPSR
jgi:beta-phosphoglucomutase